MREVRDERETWDVKREGVSSRQKAVRGKQEKNTERELSYEQRYNYVKIP